MQDETLEVESNVLVVERLRSKANRDRGRGISESLTSSSSTYYPQVDELTKMVKSLSAEMEKIRKKGKQTYKNLQNIDNIGNFRRLNNNAPQIMPREKRDRDRSDQKIKNSLQNNLVIDEERGEEELDLEIHCIGDTSPFPHLTQAAYE